MEHLFVKTRAGHLHVVRAASDDKPPLVLLHSNGGSWRQFVGTIGGFAERYSVHAIDLPGQGDSHPLNDHFPVERYADSILDVADHLGLEGITVLGCSIGGSVAIELAARLPARFTRLVIVETPVRDDSAWASRWGRMEELFGIVNQPFELAAQRVIGLSPDGYVEWSIDRHKAGAKTMVDVMWAMRRYDALAAIDRLQVPALVVFGAATPIADSRRVYESRLPRAPLVTLPEASHFPMIEAPQALLRTVLDWSTHLEQ
jgi:pimeloyl-ACP methyl ester carboxylesterase